MKKVIIMDADELINEYQKGDFTSPPHWHANTLDAIESVVEGPGNRQITINTKRASWSVHRGEQVTIVRL